MGRILFILLLFISLATSSIARDWSEIKKSGILKVGVRSSAKLVYRPYDKQRPGLMYEMVKDFADFHNLELQLEVIPSFSSYWKKGDIHLGKTDTIAVPDIYEKIDIAAEIFTVTDKREKLIKMSPYIKNVELFFGVKGSEINSYNELIGKQLITYESMYFSKVVIKELEKRDLAFKIFHVKPKNGKLPLEDVKFEKNKVNILLVPRTDRVDSTFSYQPVADKIVDVGINDGIAVMLRIFGNSHYRENIRPLFPAQDKKTQLAWGSKYEDKQLNKMIEDFIQRDKTSGNFSKRLHKYIGMSLEEYEDLINMIH